MVVEYKCADMGFVRYYLAPKVGWACRCGDDAASSTRAAVRTCTYIRQPACPGAGAAGHCDRFACHAPVQTCRSRMRRR